MTINNANVEQINVALLDIDKRIKALNIDNEAIKSLQNSVKTIKSSLNEKQAGLVSGATYDINISGNATTATKAVTATTAEVVNVAESAAEANHALKADEANHAKLADNISAGGTSGQVLTSNGPSTAPSWQDQKFIDENTLKSIMKPNYTTGRLPAGIYKSGQTASVSASITTTRGNPVFISYSGDFNNRDSSGNTAPWVWFQLYVDGQIVQTTSVDNSAAIISDNTAFAGNALAVLSAGSHTIRLDAVLFEGSGQIQFQEQENVVNLVAFEL